MDNHHIIRFRLDINPSQFLNYYRGHSKSVLALSMNGKRVQFPANALRPFLGREGIHGCFEIEFDENYKLVELARLSS